MKSKSEIATPFVKTPESDMGFPISQFIKVVVSDVVTFLWMGRRKTGTVVNLNPLVVYCRKRGGHHSIDPHDVVKNHTHHWLGGKP